MKVKLLLTTALAVSITAFAQIPTNGLVAYYPFTGNANDASGNNNNGTVNGATLTTDRYGNPNSAYSFNGSSSYIDVPNSSALQFSNNAMSISFWMKVSAWPTDNLEHYLFNKQTNSGTSQMGWHVYTYGTPPSNLTYRYRNGTSSSWGGADAINMPLAGTWFHVVYTSDNSATKVYVNDILSDSTVSQIIGLNTSDLFMGKPVGSGSYYNGLLDDIAIYNIALNQTEVTQLYTGCLQPTQASTPTGTIQFCVNPANSNYTTTGATNATAYTWELLPSGAGTITGTATTATVDWNNTFTGTATISVKGTNGTCVGVISNTLSVTINPLPTVTLSPLTSVCSNAGAFNLTGGTPNGGAYSGTGVSGNIFTPSVSGVGTFPITYFYTDGNTCSSSASQNIIVNPAPTVTLSPLNPVCSNATAFSLTGGTPSGGAYSGTGVSGNSFTPSVAGVGTFPITYAYTDGNSCSGSASQNITVYSCIGTCFSTPDGVDGSNWSYKDFIIPTGYKLDSIFMDATRPSYPSQDFDLVVESCQGTTTYNNTIGTYPFSYTTDNNSEYNIWINLTSFNYISTGMVRVSLPTNAGAVWNNLCFATSLQNITWTPCSTATVGYGGQTYNTVQIGTQCWFHENLNIGTQVANVNSETNNSIVEKACYSNSVSNCNTYGGIYNWDEAMNYNINSQGICPVGWHIPTQSDFQTLINYLGATTAGQKMKVTSSDSPPWDGTNTSGFTALSGGIGQGTSYLYQGTRDTYWSSTQFSSADAYDYDLSSGSNALTEFTNTKDGGYCIRCIQDITTGIYSPIGAINYFAIFPNPTTDNCQVAFSLNTNANVKLSVYNLIGDQVSTVFENSQLTSGEYKFSTKTSELVKGIYFINLTVDEKSTIKKMVKLN